MVYLKEDEKEVIYKYSDIADASLADFYVACFDDIKQPEGRQRIIRYVLENSGLCVEEEQSARLQALFHFISEYYEMEKNNPMQDIDDPSHGYSRLQWLVSAVGDLDLKYRVIEDYFLNHHKEYGWKANSLSAPYAWEGNDDYDLGRFDKEAFDALYTSESWYS